jgi:membrane protein implicated in regulation of membrane protease activity
MDDLLRAENLIFLAPLLVGTIMFLLLGAISGFDHGDAHVDVSAHAGVHADLSHDMHVHHDMSHDQDHDGDANGGYIAAILGFFGLGKVALNVILLSWVIIWGVAGYVMNLTLGYNLIAVNIAVAAVSAVFLTRYIAYGLAKVMPGLETYSQSGYQFWGQQGTVLYTVRRDSGLVRLTDGYGNLQQLPCRLAEGQAEILPGTHVKIDDYNEITKMYTVVVEDEEGKEVFQTNE